MKKLINRLTEGMFDDDFGVNYNKLKEYLNLVKDGMDKKNDFDLRVNIRDKFKDLYKEADLYLAEYGKEIKNLKELNVGDNCLVLYNENSPCVTFLMEVTEKTASKILYSTRVAVNVNEWSISVQTQYAFRTTTRGLNYAQAISKNIFDTEKIRIFKLSTKGESEIVNMFKSFGWNVSDVKFVDKSAQLDSEYEQKIKDIEKEIELNSSSANMDTIKEIGIPIKKLAKMGNNELSPLFDGKTIMVYLPMESVYKGWYGDLKKFFRNHEFGDKYYSTLMTIFDIKGGWCKVESIGISANPVPRYVDGVGDRQFLSDVIKALRYAQTKLKDTSKYDVKLFVIDEDNSKIDRKFYERFFKPYQDRAMLTKTLAQRIVNKMHSLCRQYVKFKMATNRSEYGRSEWPWNFVTFSASQWHVLIVGKNEAVGLCNSWLSDKKIDGDAEPVFVELDKVAPYADEAYRLPKTDYLKLKAELLKFKPQYEKAWLDQRYYMKKWLEKNLLGIMPEPKQELKDEQEEIIDNAEQEAKANPDASNDPNAGSAIVKATKGQFDKALAKMTAWHEGKRKQNLNACSPDKLRLYYKVCHDLGYDNEVKQIEDVMQSKGITPPKLNESLQDIVESMMPEIENMMTPLIDRIFEGI